MTTLFGYLLYVGIAVLAVLLMREFRLAMSSNRALRWRRAEGQLIQQDTLPGNSTGEAKSAALRIDYEFTVEGSKYHSDRVGFGIPDNVDSLFARGVLDSILQNAPELTVYYDPWQPKNSVLVAGFQPFHGMKIGACFVALIALYVLSYGI